MESVSGVNHIQNGVYIGSAQATFHIETLRKLGMTSVLKLYFHDSYWPDDFVVLDNALNDGEFITRDQLRRGVSFIHKQVAAGQKVLVICWAGISRSSTFILAYLLECGYDLRVAWDLLREKRPIVLPALPLWMSLLAHYEVPYSADDVACWWSEALHEDTGG